MSRPASAGPPAHVGDQPPAPANGTNGDARPVTPKLEGQSSDDGSTYLANKADFKVGVQMWEKLKTE